MNHWVKNKGIVWVLLLSLLLSGWLYTQSQSTLFLHAKRSIPLSASTCCANITSLHNDLSTSEISGNHVASSFLDYHARQKQSFTYYNMAAVIFSQTAHYSFCLIKNILSKYFASGIHPIQTIIYYIHNQDGEKSSLSF